MTPEQIEQSSYNELICFDWESGKSIMSATTHAQFLFESNLYYFYVPATGVFFSVEQGGNYYHGYETIVKKCSREDVLQAAKKNLERARYFSSDNKLTAHWEDMCSKLKNLP